MKKTILIIFVFCACIGKNLSAAPIHQAVFMDDINSVKMLLDNNPKQMSLIDNQGTVLDNPKLLTYQKILQFSFSPDTGDTYPVVTTIGFSPLMVAIVAQNMDMIDLLLKYGADVNFGNPKTGISPVHLASIVGNYSILEKLQTFHINLYKKSVDGFTPLLLASMLGNTDAVRFLFKYGNQKKMVNITNNYRITPLMFAALSGSLNIATILVSEGADVDLKDVKGNTAMMYAAFYGNTGMIAYLVSAGADINPYNKKGMTPLLYAAIFQQLRTVKFLVDQGADVTKKLEYTVQVDGKIFPAGSDLQQIARVNGDPDMLDYLSRLIL